MGKIKDKLKGIPVHVKNLGPVRKIREKREEKKQQQDMLWSPADAQNLEFPDQVEVYQKKKKNKWIIISSIVVVGVLGLFIFDYFHVATGYFVTSDEERSDISGTQYLELGSGLLKFSSDGASSISNSGEVNWSTTYSMQSPIADICENTAAIADQKGTQIYVFGEEGLKGQFKTLLPIEKVKVARQGVVAAVLEDGDVTWINFYDASGTEIAKNRTSLGESGYPLDIALSPDGMKIMISYLKTTTGVISTDISFYNFDSVGQTKIDNMVSSTSYENAVAPNVCFLSESVSAAFRDDGFSIYKGKQIPEEKANVEFEQEVLSIFYDDSHLGFVFASDKIEHKYKIQLYDLNGRKTMEQYIDMEYTEIKLDGGKIILLNDKKCAIYSTGGRKLFEGTFQEPLVDVISVPGLRKYMALTQNSTIWFRLK